MSDVQAGAPPLLLRKPVGTLVFESRPEATAYNIYVGRLGDWYASSFGTGQACARRSWTDNGDGTLTIGTALPSGSCWVLVTASNACAEGAPGVDSFGRDLSTHRTWNPCGP